jgi:hypothetical protein
MTIRSLSKAAAMLVVAGLMGRATPLMAQGPFVTVDYMKVAPGQDDAYLQLEQKTWKPVHEARVKAGNALGWYLYRVESPSGTSADHNYVTVAVYKNFEGLENPYPNELISKIVPAQSLPEFAKKTLAARELVRSETWEGFASVPESPLDKPAHFLMVEYMKVPENGGAAYDEVEKLWKKIHEVRIKEGTLASWGAYARVFPRGSDYPYNFATANGYNHFKDLNGFDFAALVQKAALGMSVNEVADKTAKARDLLRGELWVLVDYVQAPPSKTSN